MLLLTQRGQMSWDLSFLTFPLPKSTVLSNTLPVHPHLHWPSFGSRFDLILSAAVTLHTPQQPRRKQRMCVCTSLVSLHIFKNIVLTYFRNVGMDPCKDRPGDVPDPRLCPDSRLSVSKENIPSRSSGMSRNSPSLHTVPKLSMDWYLISMVTLVCAQNRLDYHGMDH